MTNWLGLAGGVVSAAGAIQAGQAQAAMAEYNAQLAERDALVERQKAEYAIGRLRDEGGKLKSAQSAQFAKSGVTMTGTPLIVLEDTAAMIERDALAIRYGGELEAMGYEAEAVSRRFEGRQAKTASYYRATASLLSSVSTGSPWQGGQTRSTKKD